MSKPLTNRQLRFVQEYLVDLNAKAACVRAGYSEKTAVKSGQRNLAHPEISEAIRAEMDRRGQRCEVTADRVIKELARIAFHDPSKIMMVTRGQSVRITPTDELDEDHRRCIGELAETKQGLRIKLGDKVRALELLGKHLGIWIDRTELSGPGGGPVRLADLSDEELEKIASGEG